MTAEPTNPKHGGRPWPKGVSGNPAGRPKGSLNRATLAAQALLAGDAENLTRKCVELALAGDITALRLCLERIVPQAKGRPIRLALPKIKTAADILQAQSIVVEALAAGRITTVEAAEVSTALEAHRRTIEVVELEARIVALEAKGS